MDDYLDAPMDADDVFPCKGCGEILEEGKAFELAGNRWHLDCFRCNTCNTLLDSDANLLLLGDGSLICNNCTYSCSACGNKIEDLAILTGDQAFCATCFRCRNCKRKIENLRYARTAHGIFCMNCHESLMARRRKKAKAAAQAKARDTDKSLPALPPNAVPPSSTGFAPEKLAADSDTPTELSPRPRNAYGRQDSSSRSSSRPDRSPERSAENKETVLAPPAPNYRHNRNSTMLSADLNGGDTEDFFIPVALDQSPAPSMTPQSMADTFSDSSRKNKDYFGSTRSNAVQPEKKESNTPTPHIALMAQMAQERQASSDYESPQQERPPPRKLSRAADMNTKPAHIASILAEAYNQQPNTEDFKLQNVPKSKRLVSTRSESQASNNIENGTTQRIKDSPEPPSTMSPDRVMTPRSSQDSRPRDAVSDEIRPSSESVTSRSEVSNVGRSIPRKEVPPFVSRNSDGKPLPVPGSNTNDGPALPLRPPPPEQKLSNTYMQPRAPPLPPTQQTPKNQTATGGENQELKPSPKLPRWSSGVEFSMDEDMARILGTDEGSSSILRRVSNAVRHGRNSSGEIGATPGRISHSRSVSETTRGTTSPRWPRTPIVEDYSTGNINDITSPLSLASTTQDDPAYLKRQLRTSEQRVAELERQFNTEKDLKSLNKKLIEKRKTVSVLDTQTEIMIRQLEVLAGYVERAKKTNESFDARELEESAIRNDLVEEKNQAIADRDRALLEFEQLSSKNAQLADMNNDLTHQIQERFKQQINNGELKSPNGLGIYGHAKGASLNMDSSSLQTATTMVGPDMEDQLVEGPTVVNIRKGQVKKFNWKKGSSKVAHNISKGIRGAAGAFQGQEGTQRQQQQQQQQQGPLNGDNIGLPYAMTVAQVEAPVTVNPPPANTIKPVLVDNSRQGGGGGGGGGFGFFGGKKPNAQQKSMSLTNISTPAVAEAPTTLFGSDLVERTEHERRQIPSVVTRCIEEVELRGMDVEGIYRKTGGNSQIKMIQEGFEKQQDFDISDPEIDITAVTSVLKQYFRKLPNPLLTFEVYERVLDSNNIQDVEEKCAHLKKTVNMLPPKHRDCLEFLMFHLARVASRERENLMSPKNLAVVFAPTIMRDHSLEKEMTDMHAKNNAVQFLIENSALIFEE
ncbi:putative RhoGAP group protein [Sordaria macrospora k-hell]|uniref:Putative RhoGAP group protein n=1 Tax=Sordaria macrospora (strain ATCC MYA-333 / DSM 997 / K(L3346) / K-hell) TaxID=771870 RepID=F7VNA5_SORMK|nr:putative RhoGAP group protein [Sordaria macrospora k-hell]CCC06834.1 putative RhoGAP group protein [Sordaria macrospora k-hell]